jgi:CBS domain-containing protein
MKTGYSVADAMTTKPVTAPGTMTVRDVSKVMRDHDIGSLLIVDDGKLSGIIVAEDIVHRVTAEAKKSAETLVKDVMTTDVIDIKPEADLYDAMRLMQEHDVFHLPVRDGEKLLGFLTLKDVLKIEPQLFEIMGEMAQLTHPSEIGHKEGYCEECGNYSGDLKPLRGKLVCVYCHEE